MIKKIFYYDFSNNALLLNLSPVASQNTFNNNGGDMEWSNAANWTGAIPNGQQSQIADLPVDQ